MAESVMWVDKKAPGSPGSRVSINYSEVNLAGTKIFHKTQYDSRTFLPLWAGGYPPRPVSSTYCLQLEVVYVLLTFICENRKRLAWPEGWILYAIWKVNFACDVVFCYSFVWISILSLVSLPGFIRILFRTPLFTLNVWNAKLTTWQLFNLFINAYLFRIFITYNFNQDFNFIGFGVTVQDLNIAALTFISQ